MRRIYSIMTWVCALAFVSGIGLMSTHGAQVLVPAATCAVNVNTLTCQDFPKMQCSDPNNQNGVCKACSSNANLFQNTCYPVNNNVINCVSNNNTMNCGNSSSGTCRKDNNQVWQCVNQVPQGTWCSKVFQC